MATVSAIPRFCWAGSIHATLNKIHPIHWLVSQRRHFTTTATTAVNSSFSIDKCPHRNFAKKYPDIARKVLAVPPVPSLECHQGFSSLETYLGWRGWDIDKFTSECQVESSDANIAETAIGLLSHPLTFPLTLGNYSKHFLHSKKQSAIHVEEEDKKNRNGKHSIRVCCVGARAECTLPDDYWREFIVMAIARNANLSQNGDAPEILDWVVDFVGPDVPRHLKSKTIALAADDGNKENSQQYTLTMNYHTSFLHEVVLQLLKSLDQTENRSEHIRQYWDGYILFNPGLGHPNLSKQWKPTLKFLMGTGKPILFTAHSDIDAYRDVSVLEELLTASDRQHEPPFTEQVCYRVNPFASRMQFIDPFSSETENNGEIHIVRPNHSVYLLQ